MPNELISHRLRLMGEERIFETGLPVYDESALIRMQNKAWEPGRVLDAKALLRAGIDSDGPMKLISAVKKAWGAEGKRALLEQALDSWVAEQGGELRAYLNAAFEHAAELAKGGEACDRLSAALICSDAASLALSGMEGAWREAGEMEARALENSAKSLVQMRELIMERLESEAPEDAQIARAGFSERLERWATEKADGPKRRGPR